MRLSIRSPGHCSTMSYTLNHFTLEGGVMLTTDEAKRIALIMWLAGPKVSARIGNIVKQISCMADAVRVNFDSVREYLNDLYSRRSL